MASQAEDLVRVLPPTGTDPGDGPATAFPESTLLDLYRTQVLARTFDEKAISLHRQGRIGTYAPLAGQEAAQVGAAAVLSATDYCFPTYRDHAMFLARDVALSEIVRHLQGRGNHVDRRDPGDLHTFPVTIPIATQLPHAVGVAMAADYADDDAIALASFGDGATSEGDFHEALNVAGVFDAPVVFFCQNNGYAISVPRERQTASATIARKANAYGIEGVRVDGNDVLAVHDVVSTAAERARAGDGPTLIEAVTYRRGPHTTSDDPRVYRDEDEAEAWDDPVERTRGYLETALDWTDEDDDRLREDVKSSVERAVEIAEAEDDPDPGTMFDHVYAEGHPQYARQRERVTEDPEVDR